MTAAEYRALHGKKPAKAPGKPSIAPTPPKPPTDTPEAQERDQRVKTQQSQDAVLKPRYAVATYEGYTGKRFVAHSLTESQTTTLCRAAEAAGILPQS